MELSRSAATAYRLTGVEDAPLLALDLMLPSMSSGSILSLVLAMLPRHLAC